MEKALEKLSTFNIFNYFLPGVVFAFVVSHTTQFNLLIEENYIVSLPFFYLCGLLLSSLGSLLSDWLRKPRDADSYKKFLVAKTKDPQIEVLAEVRNMTRTFSMVFFVAAVVKVLDHFSPELLSSKIAPHFLFWLFVFLGAILFASHDKTDRRIEERKQYFG